MKTPWPSSPWRTRALRIAPNFRGGVRQQAAVCQVAELIEGLVAVALDVLSWFVRREAEHFVRWPPSASSHVLVGDLVVHHLLLRLLRLEPLHDLADAAVHELVPALPLLALLLNCIFCSSLMGTPAVSWREVIALHVKGL